MHVRLVANALSDRSSVFNRDCNYFNVHSINQFCNAAFYTKSFCQSSHYIIHHVMTRSGDNTGLVWSKIYTSKKCPFEDVTIIIHCTTASHALGHPCLVSLHFMVCFLYISALSLIVRGPTIKATPLIVFFLRLFVIVYNLVITLFNELL